MPLSSKPLLRNRLSNIATTNVLKRSASDRPPPAFARDEAGVQSLEAWDIPYFSEKLREARYAISQQDLRPYLPVPHVVQGMFRAVKRLYGVEIREVNGVDTCHAAGRSRHESRRS